MACQIAKQHILRQNNFVSSRLFAICGIAPDVMHIILKEIDCVLQGDRMNTNEIKRRRTFAIISHPDAGKTTLTEKLLLYGGALQAAGSVRAKKNQRNTTSDWMDIERERGISISSTVLQFEYRGFCVNLLDTPGHRDFSEDTYRVLTAVDSVIMVIDAGKGIEERTKKLFEICSTRHIPIFTFMNKMDRPAINPLDLLGELEKVLGISVNGDGPGTSGTMIISRYLAQKGYDIIGVQEDFENDYELCTSLTADYDCGEWQGSLALWCSTREYGQSLDPSHVQRMRARLPRSC